MRIKLALFGVLLFSNSLLKASISQWKNILKAEGISIFSKEKSRDGLIPFKAMGLIDANILKVVNVLTDHQSKHLWAPKLKNVKLHKKLNEDEYIFSEYYKTPWPARDREFLLKGKIIKRDDKYIFSAYSIKDSTLESSMYIQADVKRIHLVLEPMSSKTTKISFEFQGDMKGWMPLWLINIIQKKWPFHFIKSLRSRADLY